jgi:hypothetical protein
LVMSELRTISFISRRLYYVEPLLVQQLDKCWDSLNPWFKLLRFTFPKGSRRLISHRKEEWKHV